MDHETIAAGLPLPRLEYVEAVGERFLFVRFGDKSEKIVDLRPALMLRSSYKPLLYDDVLFRTFKINDKCNAIEWSGDLAFSATGLAELPPVTEH